MVTPCNQRFRGAIIIVVLIAAYCVDAKKLPWGSKSFLPRGGDGEATATIAPTESKNNDSDKGTQSQQSPKMVEILLQNASTENDDQPDAPPEGGETYSDLVKNADDGISSPEISTTENASSHIENESESGLMFSIYQPGDGHEEDPDGIPSRFIRMQKGNRRKAKAAFEETMKWREENKVDSILTRTHPKLDLCHQILPHCFAGHDVSGNIVFCQRPGYFKVSMEGDVLTTEDILMHYVYIMEYCWNVLDPSHNGTMTNVLDMSGVTFGKSMEMMGFIKKFVSMMSHHYPQRSHKTIAINCPSWSGTVYAIIKPLLRESTRQKIQILKKGKKQEEVLREYLGDSYPKELLTGEPQAGWEEFPMEQEIRDFCLAKLKSSGVQMLPTI